MDETESIFKKHPEYTFLHSGAHRKPPARIGAPGLCRQVNFWLPSGRREDSPEKRRTEWVSHIDEFIGGLVARVTNPTIDPGFAVTPDGGKLRDRSYNVYGVKTDRLYLFRHTLGLANGDWELRPIFRQDRAMKHVADCLCEHHQKLKYIPELDFNKPNMPARYQNFSLAFFWRNVWVKFRFMLHSEYVSMGIYLDLSGSDHLDNPRELTRQDTGEIDVGMRDRIADAFRAINEVCGKRYRDVADAKAEEHRSALDRRALAGAHRELYETIWTEFEQDILGPSLNLCSKSLSWAKIGGVIYDGRIVLLHMPHNDPPSIGLSSDFINPPQFDYADLGSLSERIGLDGVLDAPAALICADTVQPFISAPSTRLDARIEYTANLLLGRRVVYMTSLSAEFVGSDQSDSPTKSLLACKVNHSWQLGRLIDRLFVMGSTRVAALMNLEALISAGDKLQSMTARLEQEDRRTREWNAEELRKMERLATSLRKETVDLNDDCDGGIEYRIERSKYYVRQFTEVEKTLRLGMIEGFQIYSTFVRRRYFSTYDQIERLGERLARHRLALASLIQRIGYRNDRLLQRRLLGLQVMAELFLMIPLIYYSGHILEQIVQILGLRLPTARHWAEWWTGERIEMWQRAIWIVPLVIIPSFITLRVLGHKVEQRKLEAINTD
jgi:hypothetical protein